MGIRPTHLQTFQLLEPADAVGQKLELETEKYDSVETIDFYGRDTPGVNVMIFKNVFAEKYLSSYMVRRSNRNYWRYLNSNYSHLSRKKYRNLKQTFFRL
jgi:hypothetical protein